MQLDELKRIWAGERRGFAGGIGPQPAQPGGPPLLVGGESAQALKRAARFCDGWIGRISGVDNFKRQIRAVQESWTEAGRTGSPRIAALTGFALGPHAKQQVDDTLLDYYAYAGEHARRIADASLVTVEAIRETVAEYASAGCDELLMFPAASDPSQVDLLAAAVGLSGTPAARVQ